MIDPNLHNPVFLATFAVLYECLGVGGIILLVMNRKARIF